MAQTERGTDLTVEVWQKKFISEYVRNNRFSRFMGSQKDMPIQLQDDLKAAGDTVHMQLIPKLSGAGTTGNNTLEGQEESLEQYEDAITVDWLRHGVQTTKKEQRKAFVDLLDAARPALMEWSKEKVRDGIIQVIEAANLDGTTAYSGDSEANKDAWLVANSDRVLFGAALGNYSGDHSADLAKVDATNDVFTPGVLSVALRAIEDCSPSIRPIRVMEDEEMYVVWCGKWAFRDFKNSSAYQAAAKDALARGQDNPLFRAGDLLWENCVIRKIPEMNVISGVGAASIDVDRFVVSGTQSVGIAWQQYTKATRDERDHGFVQAVGVEECRGFKKLTFNNKQHGLFTGYVAGVADT